MVASAGYYAAIIESLYTGLEGLNTSDYQWDASDGWSQARFLTEAATTSHLEAVIVLGGVTPTRSHYQYAGSLIFVARYQPDDDAISQARIHAAARAAGAYLDTWHGAQGERALFTGYADPEAISPEWVVVDLSFTLHLPR